MTATPRLQNLGSGAIQQILAIAEALEAGRVEEAADRLTPLLSAHSAHPEVLRLHAGILNQFGQHAAAFAEMRRALSLRPDDALYHNTMATILADAGEFNGAIDALRHACALQSDLAVAWYNLGIMLVRSVRHEEALEALQRAVALAPDHMPARAQMADMLRIAGRAAEAGAAYRRILAAQPWCGMAWWGLANIKTLRMGGEDAKQLRAAMLHPSASEDDRVAMGFALAKAMDDEGRYVESLSALGEANQTALRIMAVRRLLWDRDTFTATVDSLMAAFPSSSGHGNMARGREVIFIVGMPRSGTTLVEQILASHSLVEGAGELPDLPLLLAEEWRGSGKSYLDWVRNMEAADWLRLGDRYLERTAHWRERKPVFVDKLPGNWIYIGAIRQMLPAAKIIATRRDPLETCFSCYRQLLQSNEYSRTFEDLAAYWRDYDRGIQHWRALHPSYVHEHVYENLLADPERSIRSLLAFCGLPFEEHCLSFHQTQRDVRSPSAMQVRQPLRRDTARAPIYGALLDPLRAALRLPPFSK